MTGINLESVSKLLRRYLSIHYFLVLTLLSILTLVMVFIGIINYWQVYRESDRVFDAELSRSASVLNTIVENRLSIDTYRDDFIFQVFTENGELMLRSPDAPTVALSEKNAGYNDESYAGNVIRTFTLENEEKHFRIIVAMNKDLSFRFQGKIFLHDLEILILIYLILSLLISFVVQRGLRRLNRMAKEISKRNGENLDAIPLEDVPFEVRPIIEEVNRLFIRLKDSLLREKRFTGDAAHELRTPLAALKTLVEIAKKEKDPEKQQEFLDKVIEGSNRCAHVIDQLLTLSRLEPEALMLTPLETVNLSAIIEDLSSDFSARAFNKQLEIEFSLPDNPIFIEGRTPALEILLRNLVYNALRYTPSPGHIFIGLSEKNDVAELIVRDSGPGVPKELQTRIFDRFFRQLGNKQPGSGLGLSIVMQIIQLHHGKIEARTPDNGKGLEMIVQLNKAKIT